MITSTQEILTTTTYGEAAGNYDGSSQDWLTPFVIAANYYGGQGSIQTFNIRTTDFVGEIELQATLNDQPSIDAAWFRIDRFIAPTPRTDNYTVTVTGNFTYARAHIIGFDGGTINSITETY